MTLSTSVKAIKDDRKLIIKISNAVNGFDIPFQCYYYSIFCIYINIPH